MSMIAHPMTEGSDGNPKYSARDVRNMLNTFLAPSDGSGPINTVIEGIKMTSDQPICTVSGRTATIKTHIGILNPYPSAGPYTYYSSDMPVTLPNTTQSWKIAVLIDDPSEGHGSSPQVRLDTYPSSTPDSDIYGMVLAVVHDGIADDVAPRLLIAPKIMVNTADRLDSISAVNGQTALVRGTNTEYVYSGGQWGIKQHDFWEGQARRTDNTLNLNNGKTDLTITNTRGVQATIIWQTGGSVVTGLPVGDWYVRASLQSGGFGQPTWVNFGIDPMLGATELTPKNDESVINGTGFSGATVSGVIRIPTSRAGFQLNISTTWNGSSGTPVMRVPISIGAVRL